MLVALLAVAVAILDQVTKQWIRGAFALHDGVTVVPGFFDLRYVKNTGAAFGIFEGRSHWLALLSVIVIFLLIRYWRAILGVSRLHRVAVGLMLGGVVGNLFDRVRYSHVIDFLDFYWGRHHFPAFNVADSAICVGVGIYILLSLLEARDGDRKDEASAPTAGV